MNIKSIGISQCTECINYIDENSDIGWCDLKEESVFPYNICEKFICNDVELRPIFKSCIKKIDLR